MPGLDRTGPEEQDARTGRQMGKCGKHEKNESEQEARMGKCPGAGRRMGPGRGMGRGAGLAAERALRRGIGGGTGRSRIRNSGCC